MSNSNTVNHSNGSRLDPHYSFLQYLSNADTNDSNINNNDLSESWQHVKPYVSNDSEEANRDSSNNLITNTITNSSNTDSNTNSTGNGNGNHLNNILSSSDSTSDDEDEPDMESSQVPRLTSTKLPASVEDEDSITITKSLTSSSTSFIMPKLTLRHLSLGLQSNNRDRSKVPLLIIGRQNLNFFQNIPVQYQSIFQLTTSYDPNDYLKYQALVIVVQELRELISLLNRVVTVCPGMPIILIYERENKIQLKNIVKSFMRKNLITLLYEPVELGNESALLKMYQHLFKLLQTNNNEPTANNNGSNERNLLRNKISNTLNHIPFNQFDNIKMTNDNKEDDESDIDNEPDHKKFKFIFLIYNKWTLLVTVGLGIGICIKYYHLDNYIWSITPRAKLIFLRHWNSLPIVGNYNITHDANSNNFDHDNTISDKSMTPTRKFKYCYEWMKNSVQRINSLLRRWINKNFNLIDDSVSGDLNDWKFDDTNKFLNLNIFY